MASGPLHKSLGPLRQLAATQFFAGWDDGRLLERFLAQRDQAAFAELVHRHRRLVWGLCRRLLRQEQDAEDAFQATFVVLALKARSIRKRQGLVSWLHGVAYRCAMQTKRHEARRKRHEHQALRTVWADAADDIQLRELWTLLAGEVERLPEKQRAPFVLCCLEGKTQEEAGRDLGWTVGTVSGRLARARQELQKRLARKGIPISAVLGVTTLAETEVSAAVIATTVRAALGSLFGAAAVATSISPKVSALVKGVSQAMFLSKTKTATLILLLIGLAAGGGLAAQQAFREDLPARPRVAAAIQPDPPALAKDEPRKDKLRYDGKTFEYWRDFLTDELKPERRLEAMRAMGAFGVRGYASEASAAIVKLMREYRMDDYALVSNIDERNTTPDQKVVREAAMALFKIGPAAAPILLEDLGQEDLRTFVAGVFRTYVPVPESAVPRLAQLISTGRKDTRDTAAVILSTGWNLEWQWKTVLPDANEQQLKALVRALTAIVVENAQGTRGPASDARTAAAVLLGLLGPEARAAAPVLVKALLAAGGGERSEDLGPETQYQLTILLALEKIQPGNKQLAPALARLLAQKDANSWAQHAAFQLLRKVDPDLEHLVPALAAYMEHQLNRPEVQGTPGQMIGTFGRISLFGFSRGQEVQEIAALFEKLGPKAGDVMPVLSKAFKKWTGSTPLAIVKTWTKMGSAARDALPLLYQAVADGERTGRSEDARRLRDAANEAIKAISK
jgi:RNA polymerase sigma factor (sigma-70 family)